MTLWNWRQIQHKRSVKTLSNKFRNGFCLRGYLVSLYDDWIIIASVYYDAYFVNFFLGMPARSMFTYEFAFCFLSGEWMTWQFYIICHYIRIMRGWLWRDLCNKVPFRFEQNIGFSWTQTCNPVTAWPLPINACKSIPCLTQMAKQHLQLCTAHTALSDSVIRSAKIGWN